MSGAAPEIAHDDESGRALAQQWNLEYIEAYAVSVDPRALSLLLRDDCKRLRAVPLAASGGSAVVAVSGPSEERFNAIRELIGGQTRFVLISEPTLDALLSSRMFGDSSPAKPRPTAVEPTPPPAPVEALPPSAVVAPASPAAAAIQAAPPHLAAPAPTYAPAPPPPAPVAVDTDAIVAAVLSALETRLPVGAPAAPQPIVLPPRVEGEPAAPGSTGELLSRLDDAVQTWSSVRSALGSIGDELEETKRLLRESKEQLSVAHADNDQLGKRVRALETEVAESRTLVSDTRARLRDAAEALDLGATKIEESADLL
jgi:hypothetical protein